MYRIVVTLVPSRRAVLRRGAGLLGVGSVATVGTLASRSGSESDSNSESESNSESDSNSDSESNSNSVSEGATDAASVLVAGSLQQVANRIGDASVEAHGSVACRRLLEDGLRDPDAVALADPRLFAGLAERVTCFATNALVVAVREPIFGEYDDWRALVADADVSIGRTDPQQDPLGYRTVMALQLARGIDAESVLARTTVHPETGLLRTLEAGGVDAAFAYRNMAVEHDLPFLELPDSIDFSKPSLTDQYATAAVEVGEERVVGSPIRYAVSARTERGRRWVREFAGAGNLLRDAGFGVPDRYPEERGVRSFGKKERL
jgi:molybdate/tungstate transport system substrate-binding protein